MSQHLVWVPREGIGLLGPLADSVTVAPIPDDPASAPDLSAVEFLVPSTGTQADFSPLYDRMHALAVVQVISAGVDRFLPGFPTHVTLCSGKGVQNIDLSEWVLAAVLAGQKMFPFFRDEQMAGRWTQRALRRVEDSTVLLLGYGTIAKAVEERLTVFRPQIRRVARRPAPGVETIEALGGILPDVDVVIITLPLTATTEGLVDAAFLAALHDDVLVVNVSRGAVIDTEALLAELESGRLRAVLDVTDPEPLPAGHRLYSARGALVTPHVAVGLRGAGPSAAIYQLITRQINAYVAGEPLANVVADGY
jgi:phosphoglycerate dehydrogenase-like enzyme